jgi:hypothetical protein
MTGPASGGSLVHFVTRLHMNTSEVVCLFDGRISPVFQVTGAIVICRIPSPLFHEVTVQDNHVSIDVALLNSVVLDGSMIGRYSFLLYEVIAMVFKYSYMGRNFAQHIVVIVATVSPLFSITLTVSLTVFTVYFMIFLTLSVNDESIYFLFK